MSRIIRYRDFTTVQVSRLWFPIYSATHGMAFDCDANGNVDVDKLNPAARTNYEMCKRDHLDIQEIQTWDSRETVPGILQCDCGAKHEIWDHHDITCERCGESYNSAGQKLAPRSQWGEETGESAFDYDLGAAGFEGRD